MKNKKTKIRLANQEESYKFCGDNITIVYYIERKMKNVCGITSKPYRWFGTMEELNEKFNVLNEKEYNEMRIKTYQSNFK